MNVLILASELDRCESYMVSEFARQGHNVTALIGHSRRFSDELLKAPIEIISHEFKYRIDLKSIFLIRKLLKKNNFDIVHCFSARALTSLVLASIGISVKKVAYRGTVGHLGRLDPSSWLSFLNPTLDKIICVSKAVERYLLSKGVPSKKLITIYKGHDPKWYSEIPKVPLSTFNIPEGSFVVSCVANIRPVKGVDILLKAFDKIPTDLPIYLLLIGEIRDKIVNELIHSNRNRSKVVCSGFRLDAPGIVASTDVFVMPSKKREGLPKALIEAMTCGVSPIVTDVGGMPEVVRKDIDGLVIPPEDADALSKAILKLYETPELIAKFKLNAANRVTENFHIKFTIESTLQVYKNI